jgi:exosortase
MNVSSPTNEPVYEGFSEEVRSYWLRLPNKGFFFCLLVAWLALFQFFGNSTFGYMGTTSLFHWMYGAYHGMPTMTDDAHGSLVPLVVLALCWWKRQELVDSVSNPWWPGLFLVFGAVLLHVAASVLQQPKLSIVALYFGIYALTGLTWGPRWLKASFFPFLLFVYAVPLSSQVEPLTFRLRMLVSMMVEVICGDVMQLGVVRDGTRLFKPPSLGDAGYDYEVAAACGGMRSLIAITAIGIIYAFMTFKSPWKRAVLIASAVPLAVIGNTFRLMVIIIAAEFGGREWGLWAHDNSVMSLLPYVPAIWGLMKLGHWMEDKPMEPKLPDGATPETVAT